MLMITYFSVKLRVETAICSHAEGVEVGVKWGSRHCSGPISSVLPTIPHVLTSTQTPVE